MQQDFASRQASIGQDLANLRSTIEEKYAALQNAAPTEKEALFQQILNDERQYDLAVNGQQIEGLMANSQLNNTAFNQALQTYGANRQAFENDRAFDYSKYQDQVNWTGQLSNGQKTVQQQQQEWQNRFNYGQAIGQFSNGQQTLENQRFQYTQGRDKIADQQWQAEFDRIKEQDGIQNAISWANQNLNERQESRISANQSSGSSGLGNYKPSTASTIQDINLPRTAASMETYIINNLPGGKNVFGPPSPNQSTLIESMILDNPNLSEADIIKLYKRFGISLPE